MFASAQDLAAEREGWGARSRVRIHFPTMIRRLAGNAHRRALAVGSVPPGLRGVWNRLATRCNSASQWRRS
ncbi:MAG: hypothetical protein F4Y87_01490 [Synechococcus sp. SB0665_bin_28]|nr:hypothetical protein [Synechococcus sp. SB0665_bin_28]